ncbi:RBBP9/YdeN family alpha/beta hydrolase [Deinococcus pimensis]|uniref:RBBP9/YdeN family alpha/beta hydrolase n=1 Tax=Deinococcus pimensis TaxID=309888 RepID=UPI0005EB1F67|nr:alpha/beta hydrolase [Deinococcus pimensis]
MTHTVLVLPGWNSSGPDHWQTWLQARHPDFARVEQADWATPALADWTATLEAYVARHAPVVLVAHSLACPTVAHWARAGEDRVLGALLVAPADVERPDLPAELTGFRDAPERPLPFPTTLVASRTDPYCTFERAAHLARAWNARLVDAGDVGHLNTASGHGPWPQGETLLEEIRQAAEGPRRIGG